MLLKIITQIITWYVTWYIRGLLVPHRVGPRVTLTGCGFGTPPLIVIITVTLTGMITVAIVFDGFLRTKMAALPEVVPIYTIITCVLDVLLV